jgi:hypothetical protein
VNKKLSGVLLLVAGLAGAAWWFWHRKQNQNAASGPMGKVAEQIGATVNQDSTPEIVDAVLKQAQKWIDTNLCWKLTYRDFNGANAGWETWTRTDGQVQTVSPGSPKPSPRCGE